MRFFFVTFIMGLIFADEDIRKVIDEGKEIYNKFNQLIGASDSQLPYSNQKRK